MEVEDPQILACRARVGQLIHEKYRLDALIGVGGMAAVYMATHRNGSVVAIKILHQEVARNDEVHQRFLREAYIANKVGHEGTVSVLDDDVDGSGTPFLVMELLRGKPVDAVAEAAGGRLPISQTLDIIDQTLAVLEAAHHNAIIHRDLKPENLMLSDRGVVKVLDFGIARLREDNAQRTQTGLVMGTPSFMAPEQAMGRMSEVDARTDLWAVAATAFTLLSGRPVHEADSAGEMLVAAATRPARSLARVMPEAPLNLVALVDKALSYERSQRYPNATAFRTALDAVRRSLGNQTTATDHPPPQPRSAGSADALARAAADGVAERALAAVTEGKTERDVDTYDPSTATEPEIRALAETFTQLERALVATKQYGSRHPETRRRFDETFSTLTDALAAGGECLAWNLAPYGFRAGTRPIWEPEAPWNRIPYQLFADGVRTMGFLPGLRADEFKTWLDLITLDPTEELCPEDDMVTCLWDAPLDHVFHQAIDTFAEGDQDARAQYEAQRQAIVESAHRRDESALSAAWQKECGSPSGKLDAKAHSARIAHLLGGSDRIDKETAARVQNLVSVDANDITTDGLHHALTMDDSTTALLSARLVPEVSATSQRFVHCAALAFVTAARSGRSPMVSAPLQRAVEGLAERSPVEAIEMLLSLCDAVDLEGMPAETETLRGQLVTEILSCETLIRVLQTSALLPQTEMQDHSENLARVLHCLQEQHFTTIIDFLPGAKTGALQDALLSYVRANALGREDQLAAMFPTANMDLAFALLRILVGLDSPDARDAIASATKSPHALLRIEAISHLEGASSLQVKQEMRRLLGDGDPTVRLAAVQAMESHRITAAGPFLVVRMQEKDFVKLPFSERAQCFKALRALKADRCEQVCLQLLSERKWYRPRNLESTRALAANVLGDVASTDESYYTLIRFASGHDLRTSRAVRTASQQALSRIAERADQAEAAQARRVRRKRRTGTARRPHAHASPNTGDGTPLAHSEARTASGREP